MRRVLTQVLALVAVAALTRLVPHPPNFVPLGAMALLSGALLGGRGLAYALPLGAMFLGDLVLGLHAHVPAVYGAMGAVVWVGTRLGGRRGLVPVSAASLAGSTLFFLVTNLSVWALDGLYPPTLEGLAVCYVAALPFFANSLAADLLYVWVVGGALRWARARPERELAAFQGPGADPVRAAS